MERVSVHGRGVRRLRRSVLFDIGALGDRLDKQCHRYEVSTGQPVGAVTDCVVARDGLGL